MSSPIGEEKANRNNPEIKNRHKRLKTSGMPKVNRNKNAASASPALRDARPRDTVSPGRAGGLLAEFVSISESQNFANIEYICHSKSLPKRGLRFGPKSSEVDALSVTALQLERSMCQPTANGLQTATASKGIAM